MTVTVSLCCTGERVWAGVLSRDAEHGAIEAVGGADVAAALLGESGDETISGVGGGQSATSARAVALERILFQLGVGRPVKWVFACPSHWSSARRLRLAHALDGAGTATVLPLAVAAVRACERTLAEPTLRMTPRTAQYVVVELGSRAITASFVSSTGDDAEVSACEYEPTIGVDDVAADRDGAVAATVDLAERAAARRSAQELLVVTHRDGADIDALHTALARSDVRAGRTRVLSPAQILIASERDTETRDRERSGLLGAVPFGRRTAVATVAAATVAVAVGAAVWWQSDPSTGTAAAPTPPSTVAKPDGTAGSALITEGRISFVEPSGWTRRPTDPQRPGRLELTPADGAGRRIILMQNSLDAGLGYDEVAAALEQKIAQRGADGPFGDLQRDVVFAGRPGVSYREVPDGGSEVRWHVVVEQALQVSVGCQFRTGEWAAVEDACSQIVRTLTVAPGG